MQDLIVCTNNGSTLYSKITDSTREQSFSNETDNNMIDKIRHPFNNSNKITAMHHSPQSNDPTKNFIKSTLSPFAFNDMQPLKTCCNELTNTTKTNQNNEVSKTLFASVVKSKKVLELKEPTLKTKKILK